MPPHHIASRARLTMRPRRNRLGFGLLALLAAGLVLGTSPGAPPAQATERRVPIDRFDPLPAAPAVSDAARAARDRLLGDHWDDPDHVTLHWAGVSSFVVTIGGHLLLFDAWEVIGLHDGYVPLSRDDLAALDPEAVLVGHGHFDHAGDLGYVAGRSGAVVVGSAEICDVAVAGALREGVGTAFSCAVTGTATTPAMGTAQSFRLFADLPPVTVLQHIHSNPRPPGDGNPLDPFLPIMDPAPYVEHLNTDPAEVRRFLGQLAEQDQGGTWLYHLVDGDFTLLLGNSSGPVFDQPAIRHALTQFPGCVDVMSNAILGFDQPVSGLADPVQYVDLVKPAVFLPNHADAWAPVIAAGQQRYEDELLGMLAELDNPPEVDFLLDPRDYLVERAYRVDDPRWATPPPGSACLRSGGPAADAAGRDSVETTGATPASATGPTPLADPAAGSAAGARSLPATGGRPAVAVAALLTLAAALLLLRRRPTGDQYTQTGVPIGRFGHR